LILGSTREAAMGWGGLSWGGWMADWKVVTLPQPGVGMGWNGMGRCQKENIIVKRRFKPSK